MSATAKNLSDAPDWFDALWEKHSPDMPWWMRSQKEAARTMMGPILDSFANQAKTPEGVRAIIAFAKIAKIVKGARGVLDDPNPTPDQVAEAVQRLVERVKP
jgi:hypothetical protein